MKKFVESEHPRDKEGEFTEKEKTKTSSNPLDLIEPLDEETYYKGIKMDYENSTDQNILDYIYQQLENPNPKSKFTISEVNDKQIKDIQNLLGIDVTGYMNIIDSNAISHIKNRHGVNGKADQSMSDPKDLARIGYILNNYDSLEELIKKGKPYYAYNLLNRNKKPSPVIKYQKRINGYYVVSQAIVDSDNKNLIITTAFKPQKI